MTLGGMSFEVSWRPEKAAIHRRRRGIELVFAMRVLDDPDCAIEAQTGRYEGQYRIVGYIPTGRLLTVAAAITFPDEADGEGDMGLVRVYSVWDASNLERRFRHP